MFTVTIDDYSWEPIALTPDNAAKPWIDMSSRAVFGRLCNPSRKEIKVKILFSPRETSGYDLRFRIVDRAADQMILAVPANHFVTAAFVEFPKELQPFRAQLAGRSMIVRKTKPLAVECVVRGYLAGSGWKEYQESQSVCGIELPAGLDLASQLPEPIFTPATKSDMGHDLNIDMNECRRILGSEMAERVRDLSLQIYSAGRDHAAQHGIIVADTKFEFGTVDGQLLLIDECLTPDSSRFWPQDRYVIGQSPPSFDKQFVRDYLETLDWGKTPPAPSLPSDVIAKTSAKYVEAFERLTGERLKIDNH